MKLRTKTLVIISVTVVALVFLLFVATRFILFSGFRTVQRDLSEGFSRIEMEDTRRNVSRVIDALQVMIQNLSTKSADWAMWDDTYEFIIDRNAAFIESNLSVDALVSLKINMILLLDTAGAVVYSLGCSIDSAAEEPVPPELLAVLAEPGKLLQYEDTDDANSGIVMLPANPLMIACRPILTSEGEGPFRGSVVFARYLDNAVLTELADVTHLDISQTRLDLPGTIGADFSKARAALSDPDSIFITAISTDTITGYAGVYDTDHRQSMIVRVALNREIHKQGLATSLDIARRGQLTEIFLIIAIIVAGMVLGGVIIWLVQSVIVRRLERVSSQAAQIGESGEFSGRVEAHGSDEIRRLADAINRMLDALAATHGQISRRNAEMALLMQTVPSGLLSLDERYCINPEYSRVTEPILGRKGLAGADFAALLGLDKEGKTRIYDFLDVLKQQILPDKELAGLNPVEELDYHRPDGARRWLHLQFYLIKRGEAPSHVLAIIEDVTDAKALAERALRAQRENVQLKAIAEDPDLFREFLTETKTIIRQVESAARMLQPMEPTDALIHEIFRGVHTIKGVAGSFSLSSVCELSGRLEEQLSPLREMQGVDAEQIATLLTGIADLQTAFAEVVENSKKILGDEIEHETGIYLRIPLAVLKRHIEEIQTMEIDADLKDRMSGLVKHEIVRRLHSLQTVPAAKGLARSVRIIPGLIERMNKQVQFQFKGQDELIDCETIHALNTPLIHLLRNALDHGLEMPEERLAAGKSACGQLTLELMRGPSHILLKLSDDGRGLNPQKIAETAVRQGLIDAQTASKMKPEQLYAFIYQPGFSTSETITEVSGRGVGMNAVIDVINTRLHGTIEIESSIGCGTAFFIRIPSAA